MNFTLNLWEVLTLVGTVTAAFIALGRMLIAQAERRLDDRFAAMEESRQTAQTQWLEQFQRIEIAAMKNEQRTLQLLTELPMQYQRREDSIRFETNVLARLDAMGEKLHRALECDIRHCPVKDILDERR